MLIEFGSVVGAALDGIKKADEFLVPVAQIWC